jgi:hypothetical protein
MSDYVTCDDCKTARADVTFSETLALCASCGRERLFAAACAIPSDINQHLPLLRWLASRCTHVTEMGTRWATGSTVAFLAAQPQAFITWDYDPTATVSQRVMNLIRLAGATRFQPRCGDTLQIITEPTDLLFIDTLHTGKQLWDELVRHVDPKEERVKKYLVFHDTQTFGVVGEDGKAGLRTAIRQFQKYHAFPLWKVMSLPEDVGNLTGGTLLDLEHNNGLVVLEHVCANGHSPDRHNGHCTWCGKAAAS